MKIKSTLMEIHRQGIDYQIVEIEDGEHYEEAVMCQYLNTNTREWTPIESSETASEFHCITLLNENEFYLEDIINEQTQEELKP